MNFEHALSSVDKHPFLFFAVRFLLAAILAGSQIFCGYAPFALGFVACLLYTSRLFAANAHLRTTAASSRFLTLIAKHFRFHIVFLHKIASFGSI